MCNLGVVPLQAMPAAGILPDHATAYILVRTAVNSGQHAQAQQLMARFTEQGVRMKPATLRLLGLDSTD
jgi:hypothetical protein